MSYLLHKDGTKQEVSIIYPMDLTGIPFTEDGDGTKYKEPMAVVQLKGVPIEKQWSIKTVPMRFIEI